MTPLRVAIVGCTGRMGRAVLRLGQAADDIQIVSAVTQPGDPLLGRDAGTVAGLEPLNLPITDQLATGCDVIIEFTLPAGCVACCEWAAGHGVPLVSGTTGLTEPQVQQLRFTAERIPLVWAPNMSVGINLLLGLVKQLAHRLDDSWDIEICETHHRRKIDAPSGTALALLRAVADTRQVSPDDVARFGRQGECGARPPGEVGVHAVRLGALIGEHEVHFASETEQLTLCHRALSRDTFADGALRAARWIRGRDPGLYDMQAVLFG